MENNSVTTKRKTKKIVIMLAAFFLICGAGLGGLFVWKNAENKQVAETEKEQEKEIEIKLGEVNHAKDEDTLRALLEADGEFEIELTKDLRIEEGFVVNGTKTLTGKNTILMELYSEAYQAVFTVTSGSKFTLDGVTLDANGIANGVFVERSAEFIGVSGTILYPVPYGVLVEGKATLEGLVIDHSMDIGLCAAEGSDVTLKGGEIINSVQTGVHIQATATMNMSESALIDGGHYLVRNRGTCVVTGGTLRNASGYLVYATGEVTIDYKGKDANDRMEWYGADSEAGIRIGAGAKAYISGLYLHDVAGRGIRSVNDTGLTVKNCIIENTGNYGIDCVNGKEPSYIENVEIRNTKASAIRTHGTVSVNLKDVTVKETEGFGIKNENTLVTAKNITFENCKLDGVWGEKGSTTEVDTAVVTNPGRFGVNNNSAKMTLKNVTVTNAGRMGYVGKVNSTADMNNFTITGAKERAIYNLGGNVTAENVTIKDAGDFAVSTAKSQGKGGSVTIKNLTVTGVKEKDALNTYESVLTVTDAKIADVGRYGALASKGGKMTLTNVELKNCLKRGVMGSGGIITLKDVVVKDAGEFGVTTGKSGSFVGQLTAENLTITGVKKSNALNNNGSVMKVTGGTVSGIGGNGLYAENGGQTTLSEVDLTDCAKRGVYAKSAGTKVVLKDTKISDTVNSGIFQEAGTVVEANKVSVQDVASYGIFLKGAIFTGKGVTVAKTTDNGINVDISDAREKSVVTIDGLTVKDTQKRAVANVGGDVTLSKVVITNPGTLGATTSKKEVLVGKLVINGLAMTGVKNGNALNCNGSVLNVTDGTITDVIGNGAYVENGGQIALTKLSIADVIGRGISLKETGGKAILNHTTFKNTAQTAIYQEAGSVVEGDTLNIKDSGGYGVFMKGAQFDVTDVMVHNTTENPFNIDEASTATIRGAKSTITKNDDTPANVAIKVIASTLEIYDGTYNGFTKENGSVIYNSKSNVTIHGGNFKDNVATERGAVLYATGTGAKVTIKGGTFDNNTAAGIYGGGVIGCTGNTELIVEGGTFINNKATAVSTDDETAYGGGAIESNGKVTISSGTFQANTAEKGGAIYIDKAGSLTITGGTFGAGADVTDAAAAKALGNVASYRGGVLYIADGRTSTEKVSISNAHFGHNKASNNKGVSSGVMYVGSNAKVDITNTIFNNNIIEYTGNATDNASYGGVMYINGSEVTITDSTISGSSAMRGGAIYAHGAETVLTLNGGTYNNNTATIHAGLIYNNQAILTINASEKGAGEFTNHTANNRGGVILNNGTVTINNGIFTDNKAEGTKGGGVIGGTGGAVLTIKNGTFQRNASTYTTNNSDTKKSGDVHGGGVIESSGRVTIEGGTFQANSAMKGGVIYLDVTGKLKITGGTFGAEALGNSASYRGGAICIEDERSSTETITIDGAQFKYNHVTNSAGVSGGVIYAGSNAKVNIGHTASCVFENNKADCTGTENSYGGVLYMNSATVNVKNTTLNYNSAKRGGAIYVAKDTSDLTVTDTTCTDNAGTAFGKDIFLDAGKLTLSGLVKVQLDKRGQTIQIKGVLDAQSSIRVRQLSGSSTVIAEFDSEEAMKRGETCITYFAYYGTVHQGKTLTFADNKATMK